MATDPKTESPYATQLDIERLRDANQLDLERLRTEFHKAINQQTWRIIAAGFTAAGLLLAGIKFL